MLRLKRFFQEKALAGRVMKLELLTGEQT